MSKFAPMGLPISDRMRTGAFWSRAFKHVVLIALVLLTMYLIFATYTTYAFRRSIDDKVANLDKDYTIENILHDFGMNNVGMQEIENLRCAQRDAIAFYRVGALPYMNLLSRLYNVTWQQRRELKDFLAAQPEVDKEKLDSQFSNVWGFPYADEVPLKLGLDGDHKVAFRDTLKKKLADLSKKLRYALHEQLGDEDLKRLFGLVLKKSDPTDPLHSADAGGENDMFYLDMMQAMKGLAENDKKIFIQSGIDAFEQRIVNLGKEIDKKNDKLNQWRQIYIQKWMGETAFRGLIGGNSHSSDTNNARHIPGDSRTYGNILGSVDCSDTEVTTIKYAAGRIALWAESDMFDATERRTLVTVADKLKTKAEDIVRSTPSKSATEAREGLVDGAVSQYILLPTAMQAFVVTVLFGFLGGLTVNLLRLSYVGYWGLSPDPDWGDILISPLAGAIAATIIYLLSAVGLPVVTDPRSGGTVVSSALIGFLGFVSGFLNREAFAQVKIMGLKMFGQGGVIRDLQSITEFDTELAELLKKIGANRFAELAVLYGLSERIIKSAGKGFLIPVDAYFDSLSAKDWFAYADGTGRAAVLQLLDRLTISGYSELKMIADGQKIQRGSGGEFVAVVDTTKTPRTVTLGNAEFNPLEAIQWREREFVPVPTLP